MRGYQDALKLIHEQAGKFAVSEETILRLRAMCRPELWDAGQYKEKDVDIIETYPDGRSRVRFKSVTASETPAAMRELIARWDETVQARAVHPLVALAACNLDFLCTSIALRDGNGRVSRLLLLVQLYHLGYEVGRYISLERLIEENKDRYYETLEQSSQGWHDGKQDPWPYIGYALYTLKTAYKEFESRVGQVQSPRGEKTAVVVEAVNRQSGTFSVADIQHSCPGVSIDMIRQVLKDLRPKVECLGRGRNARWQKTKRWN